MRRSCKRREGWRTCRSTWGTRVSLRTGRRRWSKRINMKKCRHSKEGRYRWSWQEKQRWNPTKRISKRRRAWLKTWSRSRWSWSYNERGWRWMSSSRRRSWLRKCRKANKISRWNRRKWYYRTRSCMMRKSNRESGYLRRRKRRIRWRCRRKRS